MHVDSDWAGDLLGRKSTTGVIVRRGIEERVSMTSENKITFETNCETNEYFHLFINTEMLVIAARTHVDYHLPQNDYSCDALQPDDFRINM